MTDLETYLAVTSTGEMPGVEWAAAPWAPARPALHWLGLAPDGDAVATAEKLSPADAQLLCNRMLASFRASDGQLAWSSWLLKTAVQAIAFGVSGPPEPLVRAAWDLVGDRTLDENCYNFCRAFGSVIVARRPIDTGWDLSWMLSSQRPSQACLRYWILGVKTDLWTEQVKNETTSILSAYPFPL